MKKYVDKSGFVKFSLRDITSLTTTSTIRYLSGSNIFSICRESVRLKCSHATTMHLVRERLKVVGRSIFVIELGNIGNPIAVVWISVGRTGTDVILAHGTDPDLGEVVIQVSR